MVFVLIFAKIIIFLIHSDQEDQSYGTTDYILVGAGVAIKQIHRCRWFFPKGTYLDRFLDKNEEYFPFGGVRGTVFFHDVDFAEQLGTVQGQCVHMTSAQF